ncbi:hypothetical protein LINPERPRIM_LOCUS3408 [Linum perenne]
MVEDSWWTYVKPSARAGIGNLVEFHVCTGSQHCRI